MSMKRLSVLLRYTTIFVLAITLSSSVSSKIEKKRHEDSTNVRFLETFVEYWHKLENQISSNFHSLVDYFEDIFFGSDQSKFNYDATLVGFVNFADGIGRHPILFKECLKDFAKMNFVST